MAVESVESAVVDAADRPSASGHRSRSHRVRSRLDNVPLDDAPVDGKSPLQPADSAPDRSGPVGRRAADGPSRRAGLAIKRGIDIVGSIGLLAGLAPTLGGVAVLIRLVDGSPVLFTQPRAGRDGRPFTILKFRTMGRGADELRDGLRDRNEVSGSGAFKLTGDPRITRLGRILRKTSLDELPQLINVLRGEMSLVGPRPHPFDDVARYEPWHRQRFAMKPGITGLWQVRGRSDSDFDRWVMLDLEYIDNWSISLDVKILAETPRAVIRGEGR